MSDKELVKQVMALYEEKKYKLSHRDLVALMDFIHVNFGVNVYSILNRGKRNNRFDINVLGGHSGGGRIMAQYKSGHHI